MDPSGERRAVPTIFNRRELFIAASMQEQAHIRAILAREGIDYSGPIPGPPGLPRSERLGAEHRLSTGTGGAVDRHGPRRVPAGAAVSLALAQPGLETQASARSVKNVRRTCMVRRTSACRKTLPGKGLAEFRRPQTREGTEAPSVPATQGEWPRRGKRGSPGGCASERTPFMTDRATFPQESSPGRHASPLSKKAFGLFRQVRFPRLRHGIRHLPVFGGAPIRSEI